MRPVHPVTLLVCLATSAVPLGCAGDVCTQIGCEDIVEVRYQRAITGAYDLFVTGDSGSASARCNDRGSFEESQNPAFLTCDSAGFTILDGELTGSTGRSVSVTIVDVDTDEPVVEGSSVPLSKDIVEPNGPGCPPTCVQATGNVLN